MCDCRANAVIVDEYAQEQVPPAPPRRPPRPAAPPHAQMRKPEHLYLARGAECYQKVARGEPQFAPKSRRLTQILTQHLTQTHWERQVEAGGRAGAEPLAKLLAYLDDILLPQMQRPGATVPDILRRHPFPAA